MGQLQHLAMGIRGGDDGAVVDVPAQLAEFKVAVAEAGQVQIQDRLGEADAAGALEAEHGIRRVLDFGKIGPQFRFLPFARAGHGGGGEGLPGPAAFHVYLEDGLGLAAEFRLQHIIVIGQQLQAMLDEEGYFVIVVGQFEGVFGQGPFRRLDALAGADVVPVPALGQLVPFGGKGRIDEQVGGERLFLGRGEGKQHGAKPGRQDDADSWCSGHGEGLSQTCLAGAVKIPGCRGDVGRERGRLQLRCRRLRSGTRGRGAPGRG